MTCLERIEQYLKQQGVRYEVLHHARAFTAQRVAQAEHIPGKMQVKVVILRSGDQFCMDFIIDDTDQPEQKRKAAMALHGIFNNYVDSSSWGRYQLEPAKIE